MMKMPKLARHNSGLGLSSSSSSLFSGEDDIMTEIFLWLPLKSLVRFKRLSKRWYFLINDKDSSYFRRNYLSTLSSRNRIVGDDSAIMVGFFFYQNPQHHHYGRRVRFIPTTTTSDSQGGESTNNNNNINPFLSLDESLDKFLSCCLHLNQDPSVIDLQKKLLVAASSNGFLLLSLENKLCVTDTYYYLLNPVTMEWLALPKRSRLCDVYVGLVCKGDYPSLDFVEYTIVRFSWLEKRVTLLFELFSSGDNEWSEYKVSCESLVKFNLTRQHNTWRQHNTVIVSTTTTTNNQGGGGGGGACRILVYFLVMVLPTRINAIVVFDLNKGDKSLQMIEIPGGARGVGGYDYICQDYIREFDDGRVIHYVRIFQNKDFEFCVFNTESGEWYLKHKASLSKMIHRYRWMDLHKWNNPHHYGLQIKVSTYIDIHAFHPLNPNLIFLTLYGKVVCYNIETGMLELVYDIPQNNENIVDDYCFYVYQWPCWPPLL